MNATDSPRKIEDTINCKVCGNPIGSNDDYVCCSKCLTPHHRDCWNYAGVCSTYGCKCSGFTEEKITNSRVIDSTIPELVEDTIDNEHSLSAPPQTPPPLVSTPLKVLGIASFFIIGLMFVVPPTVLGPTPFPFILMGLTFLLIAYLLIGTILGLMSKKSKNGKKTVPALFDPDHPGNAPFILKEGESNGCLAALSSVELIFATLFLFSYSIPLAIGLIVITIGGKVYVDSLKKDMNHRLPKTQKTEIKTKEEHNPLEIERTSDTD